MFDRQQNHPSGETLEDRGRANLGKMALLENNRLFHICLTFSLDYAMIGEQRFVAKRCRPPLKPVRASVYERKCGTIFASTSGV